MASASCTGQQTRHSSFTSQEQVMTCTICLDTFKNPKFLPCFHTFCRSCLEQQIQRTCQSQRFPCPLCRMSIKMPSGGVDGFQTNFYVHDILVLLNKSSGGEKGTDDIIIDSDSDDVCSVEQRQQLQQRSSATCDLVCPKHTLDKEWLTSYCKQCQVPLCTRCICHDHNGHGTETLSVVLDDAQRTLHTLNFRIHRHYNMTRELVKDRQRYLDNYIWQLGSAADQISSNADEIKMMVDTRAQMLLQLLENLKVTEVNRAEDHEEEMSAYLRCLNEVKEQVSYLMSNANVTDTLTCYKLLREKGERVMKQMPKSIDKYSVVYDRAHVEGAESRIEQALGYIHTEKDERFDRQVEPDIPDVIARGPAVGNHVIKMMPEVTSTYLDTLNGETFKARLQDGYIRMIVPVPTVGAWIGYDSGIPYMDLVTTAGLIVQSIKVTGPVTDAAILQGEQLILARNNPHRLSVWETKSHQIIDHVSHIPLSVQPSGIAVRSAQQVLVCGRNEIMEESSLFIVDMISKQVTVLFTEGIISPLKSPNKIAFCHGQYGDVVCVSDSKRRQVYFFNMNGEALSVFPATRCSSYPEGICFDKNGNLVMADKGNNSVIVLTHNGQFVKELVRGGIGLNGPKSVAVDDLGRLWVGDSSGYVSVFYNRLLY